MPSLSRQIRRLRWKDDFRHLDLGTGCGSVLMLLRWQARCCAHRLRYGGASESPRWLACSRAHAARTRPNAAHAPVVDRPRCRDMTHAAGAHTPHKAPKTSRPACRTGQACGGTDVSARSWGSGAAQFVCVCSSSRSASASGSRRRTGLSKGSVGPARLRFAHPPRCLTRSHRLLQGVLPSTRCVGHRTRTVTATGHSSVSSVRCASTASTLAVQSSAAI
jgi:hypothetical protein